MSNSIRVNHEAQKIEVNDAGEYITLEPKNTTFMNNLIVLMKEFEAASSDLSARLSQAENESVGEVSSVIAQAAEVCVNLTARTDEVFGADTCRKVFGSQAPGIYEFADFFGQIGDIIRKYGEEEASRAAEIVEKYKKKYTERR